MSLLWVNENRALCDFERDNLCRLLEYELKLDRLDRINIFFGFASSTITTVVTFALKVANESMGTAGGSSSGANDQSSFVVLLSIISLYVHVVK